MLHSNLRLSLFSKVSIVLSLIPRHPFLFHPNAANSSNKWHPESFSDSHNFFYFLVFQSHLPNKSIFLLLSFPFHFLFIQILLNALFFPPFGPAVHRLSIGNFWLHPKFWLLSILIHHYVSCNSIHIDLKLVLKQHNLVSVQLQR